MALVIAVLLLFFGVRYLEDRPLFGSAYELRTEFESAHGLQKGSDVTLNGVSIGNVRDLELDPRTHQVFATLEIRSHIEIPRGSTAEVTGIPALDDVRVAINPGPQGQALLQDGDNIPGTMTPALVDRADSTLVAVDETFDQARALLASTENDLGVVLSHLETASGETAALIETERARLHGTIAGLQAAVLQLNQVITRLDHVTATGGDTLMVAMNSLSASMRRLDAAASSIQRGGSEMERMMASVQAGEGTLGRLVHDPSLYVRLDSAATRLDSASARIGAILDDFHEDPGRYLGKMSLIDIF